MPDDPRFHSMHALAVYAEPLVAGRRVVVLAPPSTGLGEQLIELGARTAVVVAPDEGFDSLRGRTFDVALVADLGIFGDAEEVLALVRRMVGDQGVALVAAANCEAPNAIADRSFDYYELFDLVAHEFRDVRMIAQLAFHGVTLAELSDDEGSPSVSVDTQLAPPDRAPETFIALASEAIDRVARLDAYAIIELPAVPVVSAEARLTESRLLASEEAARMAFAQEKLRVEALQAQIAQVRTRLVEAERDGHAAEALKETAAAYASRVVDLERALGDRSRELGALAGQVDDLRAVAQAAHVAVAHAEQSVLRAERAETALALVEPELARLAEGQGEELARLSESQGEELARYEAALRDRAHAIQLLEIELARRDRMIRDLVGVVDDHTLAGEPPVVPAPAAVHMVEPAPERDSLAAENARLSERLDALALELARREGESQATAWSVVELEQRLAQALQAAPPAPSAESADSQHKLSAALDELDALRRALAQEHEARTRAESGDELTRARAEIERQAVLLEQLGQELRASNRSPEELR